MIHYLNSDSYLNTLILSNKKVKKAFEEILTYASPKLIILPIHPILASVRDRTAGCVFCLTEHVLDLMSYDMLSSY